MTFSKRLMISFFTFVWVFIGTEDKVIAGESLNKSSIPE